MDRGHVPLARRTRPRRREAAPKLAACALLGILWLLDAGAIHASLKRMERAMRRDTVIARILRIAAQAQTPQTAPSVHCHARHVPQARTRTVVDWGPVMLARRTRPRLRAAPPELAARAMLGIL